MLAQVVQELRQHVLDLARASREQPALLLKHLEVSGRLLQHVAEALRRTRGARLQDEDE